MSINKIELLRRIESLSFNSHIDNSDLIGINSLLIYSKEIFKKNEEIDEFIKRVYNINFLPYVVRSRTLIFARIAKEIFYFDEAVRKRTIKNMYEYFSNDIEKEINKKNKHIEKKTNANENMKKWMKGLNNNNERGNS